MEDILVQLLFAASGIFVGFILGGFSMLKQKTKETESKIDDALMKVVEDAIKKLAEEDDKPAE